MHIQEAHLSSTGMDTLSVPNPSSRQATSPSIVSQSVLQMRPHLPLKSISTLPSRLLVPPNRRILPSGRAVCVCVGGGGGGSCRVAQQNSTLTRWSANSVCGSSEERAIESGTSVLQRGESLSVSNLVPRPPPRLYLAAVEKPQASTQTFLHGCEIKSGWRPGYEVNQ